MIVRALTRGLAYAGRAKGLEGDEDEVAVESAARIASDMILAGRGADVLALYIQAAPKGDDGNSPGGPKSPLVRALERLPGMVLVPGQSRPDDQDHAQPADSHGEGQGTTDTGLVAPADHPFFAPQLPLITPHMEAPHGGGAGVNMGRELARAAAGPSATPHPPLGHPPRPIALDTENFEKNSVVSVENST